MKNITPLLLRTLRPALQRAPTRRFLSTTPACLERYGFIGLGKMGYPMAANLRKKLAADDTLTVYDVNKASTDKFKEEHSYSAVTVGKDVVDVAAQSDIIITMLPEPQHVAGVFKSITSSTTLPPSPVPKLFIDSSTIDVATSLSVARMVADSPALKDASFCDAPVSGGTVGATAGTLTFMVGAEPSLFARIEKILSHMGGRIFNCGPPGTGLAAKLANNMLLAYTNIAVAEAMNLGLQLGLDKEVLKNVVNSSSGRCWSSEVNNPLDRETTAFEGGFAVALMKKDLGLAMKAAEQCGAMLWMDGLAMGVYEEVAKRGDAGKDFSVVYKWLREQNGSEAIVEANPHLGDPRAKQ